MLSKPYFTRLFSTSLKSRIVSWQLIKSYIFEKMGVRWGYKSQLRTPGFRSLNRLLHMPQLHHAHPLHFRFRVLELYVRVRIQGNTDVRMPHDVLKTLRVHTALCHLGTKSMPTHVGRTNKEPTTLKR